MVRKVPAVQDFPTETQTDRSQRSKAEVLRVAPDRVVGLIWGDQRWGLTKRGLLVRVDKSVSVSGKGKGDFTSDPGCLKNVDQIPLGLQFGGCGGS